jgi:protein-tyrosine phosphatase
MSGMVDLHCHLLPGIDDGALNLADAAAMCRLAAEDGCSAVVATPHQRTEQWDPRDVAALAELRRDVQDIAPAGLEVLAGAEVRIDSDLLDVLPLAGSRYLLLEFHRAPSPGTLDPLALLHELTVGGWRPILAHPEFVPWLAEDEDLQELLVDRGAMFQLTAMSVTGEFGRRPQAVCQSMLERGMAHFIASDAHSPRWRPPGLSAARNVVAARWGEETARRLTSDNPAAVIANRELPASVSR